MAQGPLPDEYDLIGPWSEVKLEILREYAKPYSQIMKSRGLHHLYIDGFAGPGFHVSKATGEVIKGSPLNALATQPPFEEYHFIDRDPARTKQIQDHAHSFFSEAKVSVYAGDCNEVLMRDVFPRAVYADYKRALCVLDPYNIDLSWDVVYRAGQMKSVEIFLNFMVMDMNMNVLLNDRAKADPKQVARMDKFWGDRSWHEVTYEESAQASLFGDREVVKVENSNDRIAEAYRQRLLKVAGFQYVPEPLKFPNRLGRTVYYLFFASPNATGKKILEATFNKYRGKNWF